MDWLKAKEPCSQPSPLSNALNSLQIHLSHIIRAIPIRNRFASVSPSADNSQPTIGGCADYTLTADEIKKRVAGVSVYKLSNDSQDKLCGVSEYGDRAIQFYFLNKPDALDFMDRVQCSSNTRIFDAPLTEVVDFDGENYRPIRLIPELSEVKNAIQEKKKHIAGFPNGTFAGVPVFQSDRLTVKGKGDTRKYHPAFLRKTDLEKALANAKAPKQKGIIQVAALEDIIQEMKDCSTSKSKDVVFVAPGNNMNMDMAFEER
ncbi:PREDICTED: protein TIC 22-like, chloroplastic [Erythranthe guttata]|uniref:protein TIC 22-like, chloroplastic n=1 Tax=Erythranthe guttata TaxID=4155 RepID=UPI00064D909C|nr:PREDICTED: protein TIC 22-like, chloroplastic [Erythranthe guttata]|eukprot:XP_012838280.1 PREDICTED: protein TIC 22-like, chloroplastic [Erythranthe guttata]